ncbi:class I SAM-dependent methyltransferase [Pseudooceanicola onchidii]|uniref:class I SAM-dependent methyltransferase n=1 Tax=Pseudooceanicola onchidii TaxID=2562279 RepID=UPI0010AA2B45|nr:class I SAM-dependent methyltransferase [Pseudooceanicola onchidii]
MMHRQIRSAYVRMLRGARAVARGTGVLERLEAGESRRARWLRSLFAIYDFDDLTRLDLPWWTFDAVEEVEAFLAARPQARVFEWGSGASTLWLSKRAGEVVSVEHDPQWFGMVTERLTALQNVRLRHAPAEATGDVASRKPGFEGQFFDRYVAAIREEDGLFDLIVIDGRAREACLEEAKLRLAPGGVIVLDDFKRDRYRVAARDSGLTTRALDGLAVCLPLPDSTALLSRG